MVACDSGEAFGFGVQAMALDRRFLGAAAAVVTMVIAGASALPSLLLAPSTESSPVIAVRPVVTERPAAEGQEQDRPAEQAALNRQSLAEVLSSLPVAQAAAGVVRAPVSSVQAAAKAAPQVAAVSAPAAPPPAPAAPVAQAFPPVQPPNLDSEPTGAQTALMTGAPDPAARAGESKAERTADRKDRKARHRAVRPAAYPIREFLAWVR
jgi:hypothetical protein